MNKKPAILAAIVAAAAGVALTGTADATYCTSRTPQWCPTTTTTAKPTTTTTTTTTTVPVTTTTTVEPTTTTTTVAPPTTAGASVPTEIGEALSITVERTDPDFPPAAVVDPGDPAPLSISG